MAKKKTAKKKAGGRPTKYQAALHLRLAVVYGEIGLTDVQTAERLGVTERTLTNWKKKHPDFKKALNNGKAVADRQVEESLFKNAMGQEVTETETTIVTDKQGKPIKGSARVKTTKKQLAGNVTAQIFWLKNRRPDQWRDRHDVTVGVEEIEKAGEKLSTIFGKAK